VSTKFAEGSRESSQAVPGRTAYAVRLWLLDAVRGRLGNYHWERRRRRLADYDRRVATRTR
jgi:hypothetical protein